MGYDKGSYDRFTGRVTWKGDGYFLKDKIGNAFIALRHKNFRYFWMGQCVSLLGTWMQIIGQSWLVYTLTGSAFLLGLLGAFQFLPMLFFTAFAGVLVDRVPKRKLLICTQLISMLLAFTLALLVWMGTVQYWQVLVMVIILGLVNVFDTSARQAFVIELVGREALMNAVSLNAMSFNGARVVGPALAGLLMGWTGAAFCFLVNGISFIPAIIGLFKIDTAPVIRAGGSLLGILGDVKDGFLYAYRSKKIFIVLSFVTVMGTFAMNNSVLVPVLTKSVLHQGETGFGFLMSAVGLGSFAGALLMAARSNKGPRYDVMLLTVLGWAALIIITGLVKSYALILLVFALTGMLNIIFFTSCNSSLQLNASDEYRSRVMSLYIIAFGGTMPIGNFFAGSVTQRYGVEVCFIVSGSIVILCAAILEVFRRSKKVSEERVV